MVKNPKFRVRVYFSSAGRGSKFVMGEHTFATKAAFEVTDRVKLGGYSSHG